MMLLISSPLAAGEVEDYCALVKAQAESKSNAMGWPNFFASIGNPYLVSNQTLIAGANQSVSGFFRALLTNDAASYDCAFYREKKLVMDHVMHVDDRIFLSQAETQRPLLKQALALAEDNLEMEKRLFDAKDTTLTDLSAAYALRDKVNSSLAELETKYRQLKEIPSVDNSTNLLEHVDKAKTFQAKSAGLTSLVDALTTWDIVGSGGIQHNIQTGATGGFWFVNLTYSFGQIPSTLKAASVNRLSRQFMDSQYDSTQNLYLRTMRVQGDSLKTEIQHQKYLADRLKATQELLKKASSVDSVFSKKLQRNLKIQELLQKADLAAAKAKVDELEKLTKANSLS